MLILNKKFKIIKDLPTIGYIYHNIKDLDNFYPNFNNWFWNKLLPDILLNKDFILGMFDNKNNLIGVSILKKAKYIDKENKIRTLRIFPEYQNKGYSLYLIDKSLESLQTDKPKLTVAEEILHNYSRIFINRYNFSITKVEKNLYRKNKLEYIFN